MSKNSDAGFVPMFPSPTAGSGRIRRNSARTGAGQGRGSTKKMVHCKQCGFLVDANKVSSGGGNIDGSGGLGNVVKTAQTYTVSGVSRTDNYGSQTVPSGAGCGLCGSKNFLA